MRLVHVMVRRGPMIGVPKIVGEHEVPVLQAVHGEANVQVTGDAGETETPDAAFEYARMQSTYGRNADRKQHHVEIVYGRGPAQLAAVLGRSEGRKRAAA